MTFRAIVIESVDGKRSVRDGEFDESQLMDGDTIVRVTHSSLNFKDGLAITARSPVVRRFPMIPGIDFAGVVESTTGGEYGVGESVILNGWGCGESHLGGYAEKARVPSKWLIRKPASFDLAQCMAIGTAGYTAALCVLAIEKSDVTPHDGPVLVTGAAGGVGSVAIALLARAGWTVIASTGRPSESDYLRNLGASEILPREQLAAPAKPLAKERWAAVVDTVGSNTLANALSMTKYRCTVAACGLAGGMDLPTTVAPFILRGVSLIGIDSVMAPRALRERAWSRLETDLDKSLLATMTTTIPLEQTISAAEDILAGRSRGRVVVKV